MATDQQIPEDAVTVVDLLVLGGGAAGLAAALAAKRAGQRVVLLEAKDRVGGVIETVYTDHGLYENGANSTLIRDQEVWELLQWAGGAEEIVLGSPEAKGRYIRTAKGMKKLGMSAFFGSLFSPLDLLRLLTEPLRAMKAPPDSLADYARQRLGNNLYRNALYPMMAGIYAGDPEQLSWRHALPRLHARAGDGSLLLGMLKNRGGFKAHMISGRLGMQPLLERLSSKLAQGELRLLHQVESLHREDDEYIVKGKRAVGEFELRAKAVVCAIEGFSLAKLLSPMVAAAARFADLPYAPIALIHLAYRENESRVPQGLGYLSGAGAPAGSLGTLFHSRIFPAHAPGGVCALTAYWGGATRGEFMPWKDEVLIDATLNEHRRLGLLQPEAKPLYAAVTRVMRAIPQYNLGHEKFLDGAATIESELPGLKLAGNYLKGAGVGDTMMAGVRAVAELFPS
jgi:oxygen-dependent protoporphyrinogen oxidase